MKLFYDFILNIMFYSLFLKVVVIYGPSFPSVRVFGEDDINSK